jgi:hypothetical protein
MKVNALTVPTRALKDLPSGECFRFGEDVYILTAPTLIVPPGDSLGRVSRAAVRLSDGEVFYMEDPLKVIHLVSAEVVTK